MRRSNNQDSFVVNLAENGEQRTTHGDLFVVADGMGAHAAGELASQLAAQYVSESFRKLTDLSADEALAKSVRDANDDIHQRGQSNPELHNMGTTCSVLAMTPQDAIVAHVGDSRVYRVRGDLIEQLTFDHSLVWEMREVGQLTSAEQHAIPRNVITRSLGPQPKVKVDLEGPFPLQRNDVFVLCSDGLTVRVADEELASIAASLPPEQAARTLVALANLRGGPDNVTVVVAQSTSQKEPAPPLPNSESNRLKIAALISAAGLIITSLVCVSQQWYAAALVPAIAAFFALGWTLRDETDRAGGGQQQWGKGPYKQEMQLSIPELGEQLVAVIGRARRVAENQGHEADWPAIDSTIEDVRQNFAGQRHEAAFEGWLQLAEQLVDRLQQPVGESS